MDDYVVTGPARRRNQRLGRRAQQQRHPQLRGLSDHDRSCRRQADIRSRATVGVLLLGVDATPDANVPVCRQPTRRAAGGSHACSETTPLPCSDARRERSQKDSPRRASNESAGRAMAVDRVAAGREHCARAVCRCPRCAAAGLDRPGVSAEAGLSADAAAARNATVDASSTSGRNPTSTSGRCSSYALEGNKEVDFVVQNNAVRGWYHAPWMHAGAAGREFVRGLDARTQLAPRRAACRTRPARSRTGRSASTTRAAATRSAASGRIPMRRTRPSRSSPVGTVSVKLIFTEAPVSQVPYLAGSVEWQADINRAKQRRPAAHAAAAAGRRRSARQPCRIDDRLGFRHLRLRRQCAGRDAVGPAGAGRPHVGQRPDARRNGAGAAADQDQCRPADPAAPRLREAAQRAGRQPALVLPVVPLDGADPHRPVACPTRAAIPPANASLQTLRLYFRNIKAGAPFDAGALSLDYSLQLQNGIANWAQANPCGPAAVGPPGAAAATAGRKRLDRPPRRQHPARSAGTAESMATKKRPSIPPTARSSRSRAASSRWTTAFKVIARGRVFTHNGDIVAVQEATAPPPAGLRQHGRWSNTGGTIYPGLIDLHNHLPYNVLPLWQVPKKFSNRGQWGRHRRVPRQSLGADADARRHRPSCWRRSAAMSRPRR